MNSAIDIRAAVPDDFRASYRLLETAGLPVLDLTKDHLDCFLVALRADEIIGLIGIEKFGEIGLLRSLVVDTSCRGLGLGRALVEKLEVAAASERISELWLLTIDADQFFLQLGYAAIDRDATPEAIASTAEFTDLCPRDAVLMQKMIGENGSSE
jgi:amino-acid N-acetyltransferase